VGTVWATGSCDHGVQIRLVGAGKLAGSLLVPGYQVGGLWRKEVGMLRLEDLGCMAGGNLM
jgi:hypothetical protein